MRKILALTTTLIMAVGLFACGNTSTSQPASSSKASTAPTSSVAEVKDDYVAIGGINPYEELTPTEEANIKKAEEEARLQAEAKAKADAEAKAKAQQQAQAQAQQAEVQQEQPQQEVEGDTVRRAPNGYEIINSHDPRSSFYQTWQQLPRDENGAVIVPYKPRNK